MKVKFSDINVLGLLMCRSYKLEFWISNFTKSFFKFFNVYLLLTKLIIGQTRKLWPIKLSFSQFWTGFEVLRKKNDKHLAHQQINACANKDTNKDILLPCYNYARWNCLKQVFESYFSFEFNWKSKSAN